MRYYEQNYNRYYQNNSFQGNGYYNNYRCNNGNNYCDNYQYNNEYENESNFQDEYIDTQDLRCSHLRDIDTQLEFRDMINYHNPYKDVSHIIGLNVAVTAIKQMYKVLRQDILDEIQNYLNSPDNYQIESRIQNRVYDQYTDNKINEVLQGYNPEFTERQLERVAEIGQKAFEFARQAQRDNSNAQYVFWKISNACRRIQEYQ